MHGYLLVPAMGTDEYGYTDGYCKTGDRISFKVQDDSSGELIDMQADGETTWQDLSTSVINLTELLPDNFSLDMAYPNPFNSVTNLRFSLPIEAPVSLAVYNRRAEGNITYKWQYGRRLPLCTMECRCTRKRDVLC